MSPLLFAAAILVLTVLSALLTQHAARRYLSGSSGLERLSRSPLLLTVLLHLSALILRGVETGTCPVLSRWEALSFVAFCMAAIELTLELRRGIRVTGVFVLAPAAVLQLLSAVFLIGRDPAPPSGAPDLAGSLHAFAALLGISGVVVAGIYGALYLGLHRKIRAGDYGGFFRRMPSLEELGELNATAAGLGFLSLCVTVGIGLYGWSTRASDPESISLLAFPVGVTLLLWALLGVCSVGHRIGRFGGARLAGTTIVALLAALLLLTLLGPKGVHGA